MKPFVRCIAVLALTLALAGCDRTVPAAASAAAKPKEPDKLLVAYELPPGYGEEVTGVLQRTLVGDGGAQARVSTAPDGRVLVLAEATVQAGVREFLQKLGQKPATPAPMVAIDYWIVAGKPTHAAGEQAPATVPEIAPVLAEIAKSQGSMDFTLLERLRLLSTGAREGMARGRIVSQVVQNTAVHGTTVVANIDIKGARGTALVTQVKLEPGRYLVIGQSGYDGDAVGAPVKDSADQRLYYVVQASLVRNDG